MSDINDEFTVELPADFNERAAERERDFKELLIEPWLKDLVIEVYVTHYGKEREVYLSSLSLQGLIDVLEDTPLSAVDAVKNLKGYLIRKGNES